MLHIAGVALCCAVFHSGPLFFLMRRWCEDLPMLDWRCEDLRLSVLSYSCVLHWVFWTELRPNTKPLSSLDIHYDTSITIVRRRCCHSGRSKCAVSRELHVFFVELAIPVPNEMNGVFAHISYIVYHIVTLKVATATNQFVNWPNNSAVTFFKLLNESILELDGWFFFSHFLAFWPS